MAIPTNIKTLLSGKIVEWARVEFKETWDPAASLKTVCAFANDLDNWGGGYIVIGVEENNGRPVYPLKGIPIDKIDAYQKEIYAKCKFIRPAYTPIVGIETYQDKQFIKNMIITEKVIKYPDRAEADRFFNYPYAAIEEALSNAVYHRAYDIREPIEVRIERDRIEIVSFPGPDRSITQEGLKNYCVSNRRYRNRRIGDFLKELRLTEGRNTGFKKILNALEVNGSPKPEFETDDDHSYFISRLFVHEAFLEDANKQNKGEVLTLNYKNERSLKEVLKEVLKEADYRKTISIVEAIDNQGSITPAEAKRICGKSEATTWRYLRILIDTGYVVSEGSTNSTVYKRA